MELLIINERALSLIARIMISCRIYRGSCEQHDNYIIFRSKEGKNVSYHEFLKGIVGENYTAIYEGLAKLADALGKKVIDSEVVCYFFGGKPHINKIKNWLSSPESQSVFPEEKRRMEFFLTHILLPLEITGGEGGVFSGTYTNHGKRIIIHDLIPFKDDKDAIVVGQYALAHFPSVISLNEEKIRLMRSRLLKEQMADKDLWRAIEFLDGQEIHQERHRKHIEEMMNLYDM